ncbi:protein kinase domain-containing protein [Acrocarpospora catenulata]|uniref:protein kinase domain-containing protein n=1 Tax=Acrocarpospora catenulata TaxID=2836182 RepID=UPI001BD9A0B8|nr:protein kinase [Acrocarpospora catenulata]
MNQPELAEGDVLTRRYLLQERIATGGMSVIWRAFDQSLQRTVAIKVLDGALDDDNPGRELIRREARATARLIHPDAIEVYDYGETVTPRGRLAAYVVMRLLEGRPLADRISEGPLPWAEATAIAARLALVLAAAHDRGIVHRDVTPENVLLAPDGAKLLDFGIAAFAGEAGDELVADFGTPPYVAPERLKELPAAPAVDVYSLGVLLYEMLTGAPPYPETTWEGIEAARREGPPPSPDGVPGLPPEIAALCRRCLSPEPADRPTAREVAAALIPGESEREPGWLKWAAGVAGVLALGVLLWQQPTAVPAGVAAATLPSPVAHATQRTGAEADQDQDAGSETDPEAGPTANADERGGDEGGDRTGGRAGDGTGDRARPINVPDRTEEPEDPGGAPAAQPSSTPRPTPRPSDTQTLAPLPLASPTGSRTVAAAADGFTSLVNAAEASGQIRDDVALDLRNVIRNMVANNDRAAVANIRVKLNDRLREGALTPALKSSLDAALDQIQAAFDAQGT